MVVVRVVVAGWVGTTGPEGCDLWSLLLPYRVCIRRGRLFGTDFHWSQRPPQPSRKLLVPCRTWSRSSTHSHIRISCRESEVERHTENVSNYHWLRGMPHIVGANDWNGLQFSGRSRSIEMQHYRVELMNSRVPIRVVISGKALMNKISFLVSATPVPLITREASRDCHYRLWGRLEQAARVDIIRAAGDSIVSRLHVPESIIHFSQISEYKLEVSLVAVLLLQFSIRSSDISWEICKRCCLDWLCSPSESVTVNRGFTLSADCISIRMSYIVSSTTISRERVQLHKSAMSVRYPSCNHSSHPHSSIVLLLPIETAPDQSSG